MILIIMSYVNRTDLSARSDLVEFQFFLSAHFRNCRCLQISLAYILQCHSLLYLANMNRMNLYIWTIISPPTRSLCEQNCILLYLAVVSVIVCQLNA